MFRIVTFKVSAKYISLNCYFFKIHSLMTVRLAPKTVACIKDLKYSVRKFQKVSAGAVEFSNDNNLLERI